MKILIVAKTRMGSGACIGGITFEGQSVRLIAANAATDEHAGMEYGVGEVWEVDATPASSVVPPHVENLIVRAKRRLGPMSSPDHFIDAHMPAKIGGPEVLYDGLTQANATGALYIAERTGVPPYSTMFWRPDQPLARVDDAKRIRYRYPTPGGGRTMTFVGFQEPIEEIPAGTLLRVSLAHWWRPEGRPDDELRCYVQLSGWFMPAMRRAADGAPLISRSWGEMSTTPSSGGRTVFHAGLGAATLAGEESASTLSGARRTGYTASHEPHSAPCGVEGATISRVQQEGMGVGPLPSQDEADAPRTECLQTTPPDLTHARHLLKTVFGYDAFWPLQEDIIANVLARRDTLAIMPTGGGKSLCYQLPALLFDGLTVVVSPLIALMQDQVDQLAELGIPAAFLNSTLDYGEYVGAANRVRRGEVKLLYVAPETLLRPETLVMLDQSRVECLTIDEAHCISSWGHDFRPEYRQLLAARRRYPDAVCLAFTATATPRVQEDIEQILGFGQANEFIASFNRPNLTLAAQPRTGLRQVLAFLEAHRGQSGIIYCSTRTGVDTLAAQLTALGWPALPYHAGMEDNDRRMNQRRFIRDEAPIMVATIAFGMGINKPDVRFILHYNLPENLESYYQQIGRAGRDGLPADCLLLYSSQDAFTIRHFIDEGAASERAGRQARFDAMLRYAETRACRRVPLLAYFGEELGTDSCGACDNCLAETRPAAQADVTAAAYLFLEGVRRTGQMFGATHIVDVLRGSRARKVLANRHDRLEVYGAGRDTTATQWRRLAQQFIAAGLLEQDMAHGGLRLGPGAARVFAGEKVYAELEAPEERIIATEKAAAPHDAGLFEALRGLRRRLADEANVPPYVVFSDRSLIEMATCFPQSPERFLATDGVGQRKLEKYGAAFMAAIRDYCRPRGLDERVRPADAANRTPAGADRQRRFQEVGELFAAGQSIEQLEALYSVKRGTIVQHLYRYHRAGHPVDPARVLVASTLSAEEQERALGAFARLGTDYLSPVFEALGGAIPYDELHIMRLIYLCREA